MTNNKFRTKIIYIVVIVALLVPLFLLGRPASIQKGDEGQVNLRGGFLSTLRQEEGNVDADLGKIDPGSNTMKLATFGMRGVALALLWHKSLEYEKKSDWNNVVVTSNQITMLEPRFTTIWDFLGWRLAYNASRDQDDFRERYRWVIRGFEFLEEGTVFNEKAPFLFHKAGWTISQKIGISDEKVQYRQLFRQDDEFHDAHGTPSIADRDNWLYGIPWYQKAEELLQKSDDAFFAKKAAGLINDDQEKDYYGQKTTAGGNMERVLFYVHSRMNLIHFANWYEQDGSFGEKARENWRNAQNGYPVYAQKGWDDFGAMEITTTIDDRRNPGQKRTISLNKAAEVQKTIDALNEELVSLLAPRTKNDLYVDRWNTLNELQQGVLVNVVKKSEMEQYAAIREYLDQTQPDWEKELTDRRNSLIEEEVGPEELVAWLIPEPIRKGTRGMEQSDARDEVNLALKAGRALDEVVNQASGMLALNPAAIASTIASMETLRRNDYDKYLAQLAENPDLANDPNFPKVEPPARNAARARDIVQELEDASYHHQLPNMFCELTNYIHYGKEIEVEQTSEAVSANEEKFHARKAFNEDGNVFLANERYLESMRIWADLMDNPRYAYLKNDLFRRDFMDFVDKYRHVTDKLDDAERGSLYPLDFPFAKVVRLEFENTGMITPLRESLVYLRQCYEKGDYYEVADRSVLLLNAWNGFMQGYEYLKYTPVQEYKDEVVEIFGLYVDSLQKTGREFASGVPLLDFIDPVMYYEPMTREALGKTVQIENPLLDFNNTFTIYDSLKREYAATQNPVPFDRTEEGKTLLAKLNEQGDALLAALNDAAFDWNLVVAQFPILKLSPEVYQDLTNTNTTSHLRNCHNQIDVMIVTMYIDTCRKLNRPLTTAFPLHQLLPPGTTAVDPATVPSTTDSHDSSGITISPEAPVEPIESVDDPGQVVIPAETP